MKKGNLQTLVKKAPTITIVGANCRFVTCVLLESLNKMGFDETVYIVNSRVALGVLI